MKKPKSPKQPAHNYTPGKAKRRPDGWNPSPTKKFSVDCNYSMPGKNRGR